MKLATLCYLKKAGKTLMLERVKKEADIHYGKWNGLGGKIDAGESPEDCAKREIYEESGLSVESLRLRGFLTFPNFAKNEDWYVFVYTSDNFVGEMKNTTAEGNLKWIDDEKLLELNIWDGDKYFLKWINENKFFSGKFIYENKKLKDYSVIFY